MVSDEVKSNDNTGTVFVINRTLGQNITLCTLINPKFLLSSLEEIVQNLEHSYLCFQTREAKTI